MPDGVKASWSKNVWLTCDADEDLIFGPDYEAKWGRALQKLGVDPRLLSAEAGEA
jgi:putative transcriptional regulator